MSAASTLSWINGTSRISVRTRTPRARGRGPAVAFVTLVASKASALGCGSEHRRSQDGSVTRRVYGRGDGNLPSRARLSAYQSSLQNSGVATTDTGVASTDNKTWSVCGAERSPTGRNRSRIEEVAGTAELGENRCHALRPPADLERMVRRGSTVRVRQRALQNACTAGLFRSRRFAHAPICGR